MSTNELRTLINLLNQREYVNNLVNREANGLLCDSDVSVETKIKVLDLLSEGSEVHSVRGYTAYRKVVGGLWGHVGRPKLSARRLLCITPRGSVELTRGYVTTDGLEEREENELNY